MPLLSYPVGDLGSLPPTSPVVTLWAPAGLPWWRLVGVFMESKSKTRLIRISVWVAVLSLLLAVVSSLATALAASAHTALKSMTPVAGSTVTTPPTHVVLTFTEPISTRFATVTVTDGSGASVAQGRPTVSGATVTQPLRPVASGAFAVTFRVVSRDGHTVSDRKSFTVSLPAGATGSATPTPTSPSASQPAATPPSSAGPASPHGEATSATKPRPPSPQPAVPWALAGVVAAAVVGVAVALGRGWSRRG